MLAAWVVCHSGQRIDGVGDRGLGAIKDPLSETAGALTHKQVTGDLNRSRGFPWAPPMYTREENQYAVGWGYMHHPFHL